MGRDQVFSCLSKRKTRFQKKRGQKSGGMVERSMRLRDVSRKGGGRRKRKRPNRPGQEPRNHSVWIAST